MFIGNYVEDTNSLKDVLEMYSLNIEKLGNKSIEVTKFNENYFTNGKNVIMFTSQLFEDYKQHCLSNNKIVGIIEFLEDSVENNHYLSDYLEKCKFDVIENRVIIKESKIFLLWRLNIYFKREIYRRNSINLQKILIFIYFIKNNILIFFSVMFYT